MGIGAIAQVYKARLRPNVALEHRESLTPDHLILDDDPSINLNTTVAVKVLHPYVRATILRDLKIMTFFARLSWLIPSMIWVSLPEEVSKFGEMMQDQLDLRVEAENLRNFGWNFKERRTAKFPRPLVAFTTREILVEEYELGVPLKVFLDAAAEAKSNGRNGEALDRKIAAIGLDSFL
ncbi:ABC transporter-like protein, partial [Jimgerdemannia flammicorona]